MKISIITATYNSEATIADTINSVLSQDYSDIEYLVIDGGSSDATLDIVKANASRFGGRLRWISENDHGIYDAMNKGIRMATGDIVGILNSDDYYTSSDVLSTYANAFRTSKVDAIYGDIHFIRDRQPHKVARYYSSKIFRPALLRFGFMPAHPSFYVRRSVYEQAGFYSLDYKIGGKTNHKYGKHKHRFPAQPPDEYRKERRGNYAILIPPSAAHTRGRGEN